MRLIQAEQLIAAVSRALFRDPIFEPTVQCDGGRDGIDIHARLDPYDMAVMIGKGGSMKFAMQKLIAHQLGRDESEINLQFASTNKIRIERVQPGPPDIGIMKPLFTAMTAMVATRGAALEMSETIITGRIKLGTEEDTNDIGYHLHKLWRASGKANGFASSLYLEH